MKELKEIEALDTKLKEKHWFINAFLSEAEHGMIAVGLFFYMPFLSFLGYFFSEYVSGGLLISILSANILGFSLPTFFTNKFLKNRIKSIEKTPLGKMAMQYRTIANKIKQLQDTLNHYKHKIKTLQAVMKPNLSEAKLAEGKADIEVWEQKIRNLEIEIACFEELAQNWQKKYDTEIFDQERKRLNTDNKTESVINLHKTNELESKVHDLQDQTSVEQIQQELNLMSHEEFDKLVSIELDKENQKRLETLLEMLKKINEAEK